MSISAWVAVVLGVGPLVGWLLWWWNNIWYGLMSGIRWSGSGSAKLPPGHMGLPFIGEMFKFLWYFQVLGRPDDYIRNKQIMYGEGKGIYKTHLFGTPTIIACEPSLTRFVFRSDSFKLEWPNVDVVGRYSISMAEGAQHTRLKSLISRSVNMPDPLRRIAGLLQPRTVAALQSWADKGTISAYDEIKKVTFENIGKYFASFEPGPILDSLDEYLIGMVDGIRAYPLHIPGTAYYKALQYRKKAMEIFRQELEKRKKSHYEDKPIVDLLDGLMHLKDDDGKQLSDTEVLENIMVSLAAGYETSALVATWAVYYLSKYPDVLHKLREENIALRKSKTEEFVTSDEMFKLKYTNKVVEETLRMANVASFMFRTATKDVEYEGYRIPKGWKVALWIRYVHADPKYFDDPLCFNPDRWDEPMSPGIYQVFGGGRRTCPGNMLARLNLAIFLHHLTTGYTWELVNPDAKVKYLAHPKPIDGVTINIKKLVK